MSRDTIIRVKGCTGSMDIVQRVTCDQLYNIIYIVKESDYNIIGIKDGRSSSFMSDIS